MVTGTCKVARNFQVVVPARIRESIKLKIGDIVNFQLMEDGSIKLTPMVLKRKDQEYFWTPKWQEEYKTSMKEYQEGKYKLYKSVKALKRDLGDK